MCGIIGSTEHKINRIHLNEFRHRGPDEYGILNDDKVNLGHVRLSIIGKQKGNQPISYKGVSLIFNGEIYNYLELNQNLKSSYSSDTEVLLHYYIKYGLEKTLEDINGMFSFAIFDKNKNKLFLVRDRLGIKPLYYSTYNNELHFCSEINPLKNIFPLPLTLNPLAVSIFFNCYYIPSPNTIFNEINSLEAGNYLEYDLTNKTLKNTSFWDLKPSTNESTDIKKLETLLKDSVDIRLRSEVPIGAYLSGGIDSTAIIKFIAQKRTSFNSYTALIDSKELNEKEYAIKASSKYKVNYNELPINSSQITLNHLRKLVKHFGQPFADSSIIPTYNISKEIAQNVTVALGGDGADEVFRGYSKYDSTDSLNQRFFRNNNLELLTSEYKKDSLTYLISKLPFIPNKDIEVLRLLDIKYFLEGDILQKIDRMSMANSLEVRVPFLDHRIVEWANNLSFEDLFLKRKKHAVKRLIENDFDSNFIERPKIGFMMGLDWVNKFNTFIESNLYKLPVISKDFKYSNLKDNYLKFAILIFILWYEENYE